MGNITLFTDDPFMKSKIVLDTRKGQKLKYYKVTLPEVSDRKHGFHIQCHQQFTALPKFHRENYKDQLEKPHQPLNEKSTVLLTTSSFSTKKVSSASVSKRSLSFVYKLLTSIIRLSKVLFPSLQLNLKKTLKHMLKLQELSYLCNLVIPISIVKEIICHGVCHVHSQNKAGCWDMPMKEKMGKELKETLQKRTERTCSIHQEPSTVNPSKVFVAT